MSPVARCLSPVARCLLPVARCMLHVAPLRTVAPSPGRITHAVRRLAPHWRSSHSPGRRPRYSAAALQSPSAALRCPDSRPPARPPITARGSGALHSAPRTAGGRVRRTSARARALERDRCPIGKKRVVSIQREPFVLKRCRGRTRAQAHVGSCAWVTGCECACAGSRERAQRAFFVCFSPLGVPSLAAADPGCRRRARCKMQRSRCTQTHARTHTHTRARANGGGDLG
jgi:hypothetical protein